MPKFAGGRFFVAVLTCMTGLYMPHGQSAIAQQSDASLKAAFLVNFANFTHWQKQDETTARKPQSLTFCMTEADAHNEFIRNVQGKIVSGRIAQIVSFEGRAPPESCNVLYLGEMDKELTCALATQGKKNRLLVVAEGEAALSCGSHISLIAVNNRIRFIVDLDNVKDSGLKLSSELLELAILRGRK
jgi:hypothetical protein